jgi:hypothetical protein
MKLLAAEERAVDERVRRYVDLTVASDYRGIGFET